MKICKMNLPFGVFSLDAAPLELLLGVETLGERLRVSRPKIRVKGLSFKDYYCGRSRYRDLNSKHTRSFLRAVLNIPGNK